MDANGRGGDDDARAPLLAGPGRRRNSVASMRGEFVSRLPKKVLDAVDPERLSHVDFSRSKGLLEGLHYRIISLLFVLGSVCPWNLSERFLFWVQ